MTETSAPSARSRRTIAEPMTPLPPATRITDVPPPSRRPQGYEREGPPGTDGSYDGVRNVTAASHGNPMLMAMTCDFCDQPLPEGAKFCPNCGSPVASTVGTEERKVVTVLFADLV